MVSVVAVAEEDALTATMTGEEATGTRGHRRPGFATTDTEAHHQHAALTATFQAGHTETTAHAVAAPHPTADRALAPPPHRLVADAVTPRAPALPPHQESHVGAATTGLPRATETQTAGEAKAAAALAAEVAPVRALQSVDVAHLHPDAAVTAADHLPPPPGVARAHHRRANDTAETRHPSPVAHRDAVVETARALFRALAHHRDVAIRDQRRRISCRQRTGGTSVG